MQGHAPSACALQEQCVLVGDEVVFFRRARTPSRSDSSVLLVHGAGVSGESVAPTATALADTFDVVVPDLPGFGKSSSTAELLDTGALADALAAWMDVISLPAATVLGSSYGCQVAVELAIRHPGRVRALVLVAPTVDPAAQSMIPQLWRWAKNFVRERDVQSGTTWIEWRRAGLGRVAATGRECVRHRMDRRLPLVGTPTLLVRGSDDVIVPQRWLDDAAALVPTSRTAVVTGAAHSAVATHPDDVARLVEKFLAEV